MKDLDKEIKRDRVVISHQMLALERQDFYARTSIHRPDYFPPNDDYVRLNTTGSQQKPDKSPIC